MIIWKNGFYMLSKIIYQDVRKKKSPRKKAQRNGRQTPGKMARQASEMKLV